MHLTGLCSDDESAACKRRCVHVLTFSDLSYCYDVQWKHDKNFCQLMVIVYRRLSGFTLQLLHLAESPASGVPQTLGHFGGLSLQAGGNRRFVASLFILLHPFQLVSPAVLSFSGLTQGVCGPRAFPSCNDLSMRFDGMEARANFLASFSMITS